MREQSPFTIVIVCTGNVCRSPLAEQLLRARLDAAGVLAVVTSAGVDPGQGLTMPPEVVAQSIRYGGDPVGHLPRALDASVLREADLVLTATRDHRGDVARALPRASRYTFTIAQFARLLDGVPADLDTVASPWDLVDEAAAERGAAAPPEDPTVDDIEDPYRREAEVYDRVGERIAGLVDVIAARIVASTRPGSTDQAGAAR